MTEPFYTTQFANLRLYYLYSISKYLVVFLKYSATHLIHD